MILNTFKTWVIVLWVILTSSITSSGQTLKGCGVLINSNGNILTSTQVIREQSDSIVVQLWQGDRYPATIISIDKASGLVLLSITEKQQMCAHLRLKHDKIIPPKYDECSNVIGYLEGEFDPRGALIGEVNDPNKPAGHFRVRMGSAYNCAGAPILDESALLIGIIDKGTTESDTVQHDENYMPPPIYGLDATLILPFLDLANVGVTYTNKRDPYKLKHLSNPMDRIEKTVYIGSVFTVLIFDKK